MAEFGGNQLVLSLPSGTSNLSEKLTATMALLQRYAKYYTTVEDNKAYREKEYHEQHDDLTKFMDFLERESQRTNDTPVSESPGVQASDSCDGD